MQLFSVGAAKFTDQDDKRLATLGANSKYAKSTLLVPVAQLARIALKCTLSTCSAHNDAFFHVLG